MVRVRCTWKWGDARSSLWVGSVVGWCDDSTGHFGGSGIMIGKQDGGTWDAVEQGIGEMINELFVRGSGKRGRGGGERRKVRRQWSGTMVRVRRDWWLVDWWLVIEENDG